MLKAKIFKSQIILKALGARKPNGLRVAARATNIREHLFLYLSI
jgi:hypothetical protein